MKKLTEFLRGEGHELVVGDYTIFQTEDGDYFIQKDDGDGTSVEADALEEKIAELYRESY